MRAIVIGGGISGLACAYRLEQLGVPVLLLERAERVGGMIQSVEQDGFLFEAGPQSFQATELLQQWILALGLTSTFLAADPKAARFVLVKGRLRPVPLSPPALLGSSLLSFGTKFRLIAEPLWRSRPPADDESVADFVRRKFGPELLELLVGPFASGIYAGDPEKLSLRSAFPRAYQWEKDFGSVLRGAMKSRPAPGKPRPTLGSFRSGVAELVRALAEKLGEALHCSVEAQSISRGKSNGKSQFEVRVSSHGRVEPLTASAVVVATDTRVAGRLLEGVSGHFPKHFARIEYAPVAVVGLGYRREQVENPADGFGFLVPRQEGLRTLGCVWNSCLFPGRAPDGMLNLAIFAGGATDPKLLELSDGRIVEVVSKETAGVMKIQGQPVIQRVQRYERALPQYNLGHGKSIATLRELAAASPGLFLTGNYLEGPAIGACVEQACRTAEAVAHYLASTGEMPGG